ncbi:hypothetical protein EX30DRAFT_342401 [Ascodesmis nigricans]|uniref:Stress-associated endoplasmic reticulum protein n=1 Tax=Ascodesmis nigricans TaxID=341454 RepID=A0A4S2MQ16_9PEZI|nr:hypothetical protein EX30DRAFT_342401 [Ascodesmis nigricans]
MAQMTPQQRKAVGKFQKRQEMKMGHPEIMKTEKQKASIPKGWLVLLVFVVFGGIIFELVRLIFGRLF